MIKDSILYSSFQVTEDQAAKYSDIWVMKNNELSPLWLPNLRP